MVWEAVYFATWGGGRLTDAPVPGEGFRERNGVPRGCSRPFPEAFSWNRSARLKQPSLRIVADRTPGRRDAARGAGHQA